MERGGGGEGGYGGRYRWLVAVNRTHGNRRIDT